MNKTSNCDRMRQYQNRSSQNKESEAEDRNFDIIQSLGSKGEKMNNFIVKKPDKNYLNRVIKFDTNCG